MPIAARSELMACYVMSLILLYRKPLQIVSLYMLNAEFYEKQALINPEEHSRILR